MSSYMPAETTATSTACQKYQALYDRYTHFQLPLFDEPCNPATVSDFSLFKGAYSHIWNEQIARHDGYIIMLGEYHGGMPGSLKMP